jgi:hypothetical protein
LLIILRFLDLLAAKSKHQIARLTTCNVPIVIWAAALALADPGQKGNSAIRHISAEDAQNGLSVLLSDFVRS